MSISPETRTRMHRALHSAFMHARERADGLVSEAVEAYRQIEDPRIRPSAGVALVDLENGLRGFEAEVPRVPLDSPYIDGGAPVRPGGGAWDEHAEKALRHFEEMRFALDTLNAYAEEYGRAPGTCARETGVGRPGVA